MRKIIKGFKVKIHPSKEQIILLQKSFGSSRFA
ncbi:MAG: helix-turn-helix domain-containing protein, partial [Sarcina sp.]